MGRTHSLTDDAWLLLKLSAADQALYDAEMRDYFNPREPSPNLYDGTVDMNFASLEPHLVTATGYQQDPIGRSTFRMGDVIPTVLPPKKTSNQVGVFDYKGSIAQPDKRFTDLISEDQTNPLLNEFREHVRGGSIPTNYNNFSDDLRVLFGKYRDDMGWEKDSLSPKDYLQSAFDDSIEGGLLDLGIDDEAAEIRQILRNEAGTRISPEAQTILGQFHPQFPNPYDLAWAEDDPAHSPELAAQIKRDRKYPMTFFRQSPETSTPGREWIDPRTGKETSTLAKVPLDPYVKTIGLPKLMPFSGTTGFEEGIRHAEHAKKRPFPMFTTPGLFATVPSLRDVAGIVSLGSSGKNPVYTGIRGDPHKEPFWLRTPDEAPERLHEAYLHDAQPASKLFDPFSMIPGYSLAQKYSEKDGYGDSRMMNDGDLGEMMNRIMRSHVPSITASLNREGQPMTIDDKDVIEHVADVFRSHGQHGIGRPTMNYLDKMGMDKMNNMIQHLSKKYDLPVDILNEHFLNQGGNVLENLSQNRFIYNAAKASGMDFFPTRKVPYPRDEHGFPLNTSGEQLSSNALSLMGGLEAPPLGVTPSQTRHPRMPKQEEQLLLEPPTNREIDILQNLQREGKIDDDTNFWNMYKPESYMKRGLTKPMEEALRELRRRKGE
tara:strand:- start:3146 stop:5119 length:1974 start_codon:yes stop_codon:yes gene_type:complete